MNMMWHDAACLLGAAQWSGAFRIEYFESAARNYFEVIGRLHLGHAIHLNLGLRKIGLASSSFSSVMPFSAKQNWRIGLVTTQWI